MIYYIAGPMRGIPFYNFPAFDATDKRLNALGHQVLNPAEMDRQVGFDAMTLPESSDWSKIPENFSLEECVERDLDAVKACDVIYLLRGWETSEGSKAELAVAKWLGKKVEYEESPVVAGGEVRITNAKTGGQKGSKLARFDLVPEGPLWELAELYGRGASKYADDNWRKGYSWRLSFAACQRHLWQFWSGEDAIQQVAGAEPDPTVGTKHVIAAAWHCLALAWFMEHRKDHDDRPKNG